MISKNQIKRILSLQQKKFRKQLGLFFVEGEKAIQEFINSDFELVELYVTEPIFQEIKQKIHITEIELKKISALNTANNALAVFKIKESQPIDIQQLIVALDKIRDPGNLGTIIRLCDWFGINNLICSKDTVDAYNPKVIQASMGSITRVNISYLDINTFIKDNNLFAFGTFLDGESIYTSDLPSQGVIIMGNEANGISKETESLVKKRLTIPRFGNATESLNVATATAIILSEFRRSIAISKI